MCGWEMEWSDEASLLVEVLTCLPFDRYRNPELEWVVLPASCLSQLKDMGVRLPWLFKIESFTSEKSGVLEFCAVCVRDGQVGDGRGDADGAAATRERLSGGGFSCLSKGDIIRLG